MTIQSPPPPSEADLIARGCPKVAYFDNDGGSYGTVATVFAVKRGKREAWPVHTMWCAKDLNALAGVSDAQAQAMLIGLTHGWEAPGAFPSDPNQHERPGSLIKSASQA